MKKNNIALTFVCLAAIVLMSMKIDLYNCVYAEAQPVNDVPVFLRFLGEGRSIISSMSILQADLYWHGGVGHFFEEHQGVGVAGVGEDCEACKHSDKHSRPEVSPFNILFRISQEIDVTEHIHLQDSQIKEIVPWLYYAAEIDPGNIQAYTLTGFYLADRLGKVSQGIAFLKEGLRKNPDSWEINAEIGRIYFQRLKDHEQAVRFLSEAWNLMQKVPHDKFQERFVLSFLVYSYEGMGQEKKALPFYEYLNKLFPNDVFDKKIKRFSPLK
ncbi:MAG: hypothetical protein KAI70_07855 [Candidatus Omnitrophica bacterium]|nr:hypothetical protein [Candidatus Omnitrophota bacterium]